MNRRDFLQRAGLIAAGVVAADQLDLLDRLGWKRKLFPGWRAGTGLTITPQGPSVLTGEPIVEVLDQYGRVIARTRAVDGVAEFTNLYPGPAPIGSPVRLTFTNPGFSVIRSRVVR